ncbi:MAG: hypothetical protein HOY78_12470 [Saccharothrix sp.]|nr:hypothetical protein [Saccharothrix sp.]
MRKLAIAGVAVGVLVAGALVVGGVYTLLSHTPHAGGTTMLVRFQPGGVGGFRAGYHLDITDGLITKATLEYA